MFTKHLDLIRKLQSNSKIFSYMYGEYLNLEREIDQRKLDLSFDANRISMLKHQKRTLHQEIYFILKKLDIK